jgi:hypothetical protein
MDEQPKPDQLIQASELVKRYAAGLDIGGSANQERNGNLVLAAALLAIASELRDMHNVLVEIQQQARFMWSNTP